MSDTRRRPLPQTREADNSPLRTAMAELARDPQTDPRVRRWFRRLLDDDAAECAEIEAARKAPALAGKRKPASGARKGREK
ncbi:MAG TPA: hypothetical protein VKE74_17540 [Gemmataceae bacterium]|nr:hypothetical protein [Gemmataceae bacterium]